MIVAKWIWLNPNYKCSECRMTTSTLSSRCPFCGALMTNEEEMWIEFFQYMELNEYKKDN